MQQFKVKSLQENLGINQCSIFVQNFANEYFKTDLDQNTNEEKRFNTQRELNRYQLKIAIFSQPS